MTKSEARGDWHQIKGKTKQAWARLADDAAAYRQGQEEESRGRAEESAARAERNRNHRTD